MAQREEEGREPYPRPQMVCAGYAMIAHDSGSGARLGFCPLTGGSAIDAIIAAYGFTSSGWEKIRVLHVVYMTGKWMAKKNRVRCECSN